MEKQKNKKEKKKKKNTALPALVFSNLEAPHQIHSWKHIIFMVGDLAKAQQAWQNNIWGNKLKRKRWRNTLHRLHSSLEKPNCPSKHALQMTAKMTQQQNPCKQIIDW